jgi:hypothetical protein
MDKVLPEAITATERFAGLLDMRRAEIFHVRDWKETILSRAKDDPRIMVEAGLKANAAVKRFDSRLLSSSKKAVTSIQSFVIEDLKLPWPWLTMELLCFYNAELVGCLCDTRFEMQHVFEPQSPKIDRRFRIPAGTARAEAIKRLGMFCEEALNEISGERSRKRMPHRPNATRMARDLLWFYRKRIKGESIRSLAREYHQKMHPEKSICSGDRSTVQTGIDECWRILSVPRFTYPHVQTPCRN